MADFPKFVLMVHPPMSRQGAIWQSILRSQGISVLCESPDVDLAGSLSHLLDVGMALPDLVLIDTRLQRLNPYAICRWSQRHCPRLKIVLVNGAQLDISPSEREWAMHQGAADLLPRLRREHLVTGSVSRVQRILELLDSPPMDQGALVAAVFASRDRSWGAVMSHSL